MASLLTLNLEKTNLIKCLGDEIINLSSVQIIYQPKQKQHAKDN